MTTAQTPTTTAREELEQKIEDLDELIEDLKGHIEDLPARQVEADRLDLEALSKQHEQWLAAGQPPS